MDEKSFEGKKNTEISRRFFLKGALALGAASILTPSFPRAAKAFWGSDKVVYFANFDQYTGRHTVEQFHKETGLKLKTGLIASNQELFMKLRANPQSYDLIIASQNWVPRYRAAGLIQPLDYSKLPNVKKNLMPRFRDSIFDPGRLYSATYAWGTVGIGYRKSSVDGIPNSWKWLYDSSKYKGRIALAGECDDLLGPALIYLGYSINTTDLQQIEAARQLIIAQQPNIGVVAEDNGQDLLASREVDLAVEYSGDIWQVHKEDQDIDYVLPKEGGIKWQDVMCIPKGARHKENALAFINFIYGQEASVDLFETIEYATPNQACFDAMPQSYRDNRVIFPPKAELKKCQTAIYTNEDTYSARSRACVAAKTFL